MYIYLYQTHPVHIPFFHYLHVYPLRSQSNGPYNSDEEKVLKKQLKDNIDANFVVHLGDLGKKKKCDKETYEDAANFLKQSQLPMFVLPGDEDWMDCDVNPKKAIKFWGKSFIDFEQNWKNANDIPKLVERSGDRAENFAFLFQDVLFIGINNINVYVDEDEYKLLEKDTNAWVKSQLKAYEDGPLRAVVMFAHAYRFKDTFEWISKRLEGKGVDIFLLHGDGGIFDLNKPLSGGFYEVVLDSVGRAPPLKVTILNEPSKNVFNKDEIFLGDDVMIDRQGGEY